MDNASVNLPMMEEFARLLLVNNSVIYKPLESLIRLADNNVLVLILTCSSDVQAMLSMLQLRKLSLHIAMHHTMIHLVLMKWIVMVMVITVI